MSRGKNLSEMLTPSVLSVQSSVSFGHVGNSAALLPLQRLGFDVWQINTVQLGHHPGYGQFCGHIVETERLSVIVDGVLSQAPLGRCEGLLVGYLGDARVAGLVERAWTAIKHERPDLVCLLDPVIGDDGPGIFVKPDVPIAILKQLMPLADVLTPNRFELAYLAKQEVQSLNDARRAAIALLELGPKSIIATGLTLSDHPEHLGMLAVTNDACWLIKTPRIEQAFSGTGDTFSALFLGHYLKTCNVQAAFERSANAIYAVVEMTARHGGGELDLIAAQDEFAMPEVRFFAQRLS